MNAENGGRRAPERKDRADRRALLRGLYEAAVRAAQPDICLPPFLPAPPRKGRLVIFAIGKAAGSMSVAAETFYATNFPGTQLCGIGLTRYGHARPTRHIKILEASHPVPDEAGVAASRRLLALAETLDEKDMALVLLSGGGSALATLPIEGVSLADKQTLTRALLHSNAPIAAINCVRKHLSRIKGGWLAHAFAPASSLTLAISDVADNDPAVIASGPTMPDPTTHADALAVLERYCVTPPVPLREALLTAPETPKSGASCFTRAAFKHIVSGTDGLIAAARFAETQGYEPISLGAHLEGEARELATAHARMALDAHRSGRRCVILSGGEAGVTFMHPANLEAGGPNQEYALALALELQGTKGISAIAGDTDGIDGGTGAANDPAGAFVFPDTLRRASAAGLDPVDFLARHDSGTFFGKLGDLICTGPSFTNVNDFRAILIENKDS